MTLFQVGELQKSQSHNEGKNMAKSNGFVRAMTMDNELRRPQPRGGNNAKTGYDRRKEIRDLNPVNMQRTQSNGSDNVRINERIVHVNRLNQSNSSLNSSDGSLNNSHNSNNNHLMSSKGFEKKSSHLPQRDYTLMQKKTHRPKLNSNGKSTSSESENGINPSNEYYDGDVAIKSQFSNGNDLDRVASERRHNMQRELETKLRRNSNQSRTSSTQSWSDHDPLDSSSSDVFALSYDSHLSNGHRQNGRAPQPNSGASRFLDLQDEKSPGYRKVYLPDRAFDDSIGGCLKLYEEQTANGIDSDVNGDTGSNGSRSSGKTRRERNLLRDLVCLLYRKDLLLDDARPYVRRALQLCEIDARTLNK